jgi:hypothetical protein
MSAKTSTSITLDPQARSKRLSKTPKPGADLKSIAITISREQATQLAKALMDASQEWNEIDIHGYRPSKRQTDKSKTYHLTINIHID